jgi:hypothetical protein
MLWRFMSDDDIPLTNNEAERALRGYVLWRKGSYGVGNCFATANTVVGGDSQTTGALSSGMASRSRPSLHRENGLPPPCRVVCIKPLPVNGYVNVSYVARSD